MPVQDYVLGARITSLQIVAERRAAVLAAFEHAASNDDDLSAGDRHEALQAFAGMAQVEAELAIEGEEGERYLLTIADGTMTTADVQDSRSREHLERPRGKVAPTLRARDGAIDELLEQLRAFGVQPDEVAGDELALPTHWHERDTLVRALAAIAPHLRNKTVRAIFEISGVRYDVAIEGGQVECRPLYTFSEEAGVAARFDDLVGLSPPNDVLTVPVAARVAPKRAPAWDAAQPYTTGTAQQRDDAWCTATEYGRKAVPLAQTIAAVRDPANREPRYDELRRRIYHYLAKRDVPEVHEVFTWALREESDEVAATVSYIGWRLEGLVAALPAQLAEAQARGDQRTAARIAKLLAEAS
jgi:hypothetical protein